MRRESLVGTRLRPRSLLMFAAALFMTATPLADDAKRPYEMVRAGRTSDGEKPLLELSDPAGWIVEAKDAEASLVRNTETLLFGPGVFEFRYRAAGSSPEVFLRPPAPIPVEGAFDTATLWVYGRFVPWQRKKGDDPVKIAAVFSCPDGGRVEAELGEANHPEWFLKRVKMNEADAARCAGGAAFEGFRISGIKNEKTRNILFASFCAFKDARQPVTLPPRPKRGFALFPESNQGFNTGEGALPFPTSPLTVMPPVQRDALLEVRFPEKAGVWDGLAFRYEGGEWIKPASGGGIYFASGGHEIRAQAENMRVSRGTDFAEFKGDFVVDGKVAGSGTVRFRREGQSVAVDMFVRGGNVSRVTFGRWRGAKEPKAVPIPYYTYCIDYELNHRPSVVVSSYGGRPLFFSETIDWTQCAGSYPEIECIAKDGSVAANGTMLYRPLYGGGGIRPECVERFVFSFARDFAGVLPSIPNPPSPHRKDLAGLVWISHNSTIRDRDRRQMRSLRRRGMKHMMITDHETMWRDGLESFTYRTEAAPKKGGDVAQRAYTRFMIDELGFRYGPYNNWMDFAPVNAFWNPDFVSLDPKGQFKKAWTRCYQPKPAFMPLMCGRLSPQIQEKFGFNCAYCDVHTTFSPWIRVDYDARMPDAGSAFSPFYATGEVMLQQKRAWKGPVMSEGGVHCFWAGLTDGNYAQDGTYFFCKNPWLVDFDLLRMHPLECDFGMGGYHFWGGRGKAPSDASLARDQLLAATAAFGHLPQLSDSRDETFQARSYFMLQALSKRYALASASRIGYVDEEGRIEPTDEAVANGAYRRNMVVVEYDDGTVVAANGNGGETMRAKICGETVELPPFGYWGRTGDGKVRVFSGMHGGHRMDFAESEEYAYVAGRGTWTETSSGATDGELTRIKEGGQAEEIFIRGGTAAELPYAAASAVALDFDGKEIGPAPFTVSGGRTRLAVPKGGQTVSYRITAAKPAPKPPYEMVESGRVRDDGPALCPLEDADGWRVETEGATACLQTARDRVLFGGGVARLFYRAEGSNATVRLRLEKPAAVPSAFDTCSLWVWGHLLPYYRRPGETPLSIRADFADGAGRPFSVDMRDTNFSNWYMIRRRLEPEDVVRSKNGGMFLGFTFGNISNRAEASIDITSFRAFAEELRPLNVKPRAKRGYMNFKGADAGLNTGEGRLPFPDSPLTVAPPPAEAAKVEFRFPSKASVWDDFAFRYAGGEWQNFAVGGGVWFSMPGDGVSISDMDVCGVVHANNRKSAPMARATAENGTFSHEGGSAVFRGDFMVDGRKAGSGEIRFTPAAQSVIVDVWVKGGNVQEVRFGRWRAPGRTKRISVPYYTYRRGRLNDRPCVVMANLGGETVFFAAAMDWTQSAASVPWCFLDKGAEGTVAANGATSYRPRTDGIRNDCRERFVWSVSGTFDEVLPSIPNPPSPFRAEMGSKAWRSYAAGDRAKDMAFWAARKRRGLAHLRITDHEDMWRDDFESFTFRTNCAPRKGGDAAQFAYTRFMIDKLGYSYGPYNTFLDMSTVSEFWSPDRIMRNPDGQLIPGWQRCYVPKAHFAAEMNDILSPAIQEKFRFNCAYCDQTTIFTPWTRIDYDARIPGAATFAATYYAYGETLLKQRETWKGPVVSEGGAHFMYSGLSDGNYAQEYEYEIPGMPWLVDFDLLRIHPLECNLGFSSPRGKCGGGGPSDDYSMDYWLAATMAFGHVGQMRRDGAREWRNYFMTQAIAARYCAADAKAIRYLGEDGNARSATEALKDGSIDLSHVVVIYGDGTLVAANGSHGSSARTMEFSAKGRKVSLPSGGVFAKSGDGKVEVFCGLNAGGDRARYAVSDEYAYVGSEKSWTSFPAGGTDGELVRLFGGDGTEEVLMGDGATTVELPYAAAEVTGLDEARNSVGPIAFTVENGRTRIGKFPAHVVSCRVKREAEKK